MADMNPIKYFVAVLIIVVLFSVLATYAGEKAEDADLGSSGTGSLNQTILSNNGTSTTLTLSDSDATISSLSAVSKNNSWLEFDGIDDYIVNKTAWSVSGSATINVWYNRSGNSSAHQYFLESWSGTSPLFGCNDQAQVWIYVSGDWGLTPEPMCDWYNDVWTMYTYVFNGSNYLTYINASLVNVSEVGGGTTFTGFEIGGSINDGDGTPTVNGSLDELRVYDISLTQATIDELYASGINANPSLNDTSLALWLKFDEGIGTTAYSVSDNSINGTISGGSWKDDGVDNTLTENTDYNLTTNIFTVINDNLSWTGINASYTDAWDTEYGFHKSIMDLVAGFVALAALTFVILILFKILKENGVIN